MIQVTLDEVRRRGWRRVGVLGFGDPRVPFYTEPLGHAGVACEIVEADLQASLGESIRRVMEGRADAESTAAARRAIAALRARKVDGIIPGCTEIPLLLREDADDPDLVNPAQLLAEAAVRHASA